MHSTNFFASFIFLFLFTSCNAQCPDYVSSKIDRCVQPVVEYAKVLNQQENITNNNDARSQSHFGKALQFPKLGGQVFRELCRLIRAFDLCVQSYKQVCPKHITINLIDASYGYLCTEGFETFMASAECLMSLDQKPAVKHCHDQTLNDIENANSESTLRMESKLTRMCGALNYFAACVRQHIWQSCGIDAWHVIFRVLKDTTRTLMPSCVFSGESAKLDAEQRQRQAEEDEALAMENIGGAYANRIANHGNRGRSTSSTQLAIQQVSSENKDQEPLSHSLEAQNDESEDNGMLESPIETPIKGQLNDRPPISFEIHEESQDNRLDQDISTARFGTWSSPNSVNERSQNTILISLFIFCILNRNFII